MAADRFLKFPILNRTSQPATRPPNFRTPARACKDPPEYTRREEERGSGRKGVQPAKPASQPTSLPCIGGRAVRPLVYSGRAGVVNHCIAAAAPVGVVAGLRWPLCEGRVPAVSTAVSQRPRLRALSLDLQRSHRCSAHPSLRGGACSPARAPARAARLVEAAGPPSLSPACRAPRGPSQATNSSPACRATATAAAVVLHAGGAAGIRYSEGSAGGLGGLRRAGSPTGPRRLRHGAAHGGAATVLQRPLRRARSTFHSARPGGEVGHSCSAPRQAYLGFLSNCFFDRSSTAGTAVGS